MPLIYNATLLDLSLPGTHDTLTYDLAPFVADGAEEIPLNLSYFLHDLLDPIQLGNFIRNQVRGVLNSEDCPLGLPLQWAVAVTASESAA